MNKTLICILTLMNTLCVIAQTKEPPITGTKYELIRRNAFLNFLKEERGHRRSFTTYWPVTPSEPGWTVGTNLLSGLEEDAGLSLTVEYRYSKHWEVGLMGTYVFGSFLTNNEFPHYGVRFQPDIKYYFIKRTHQIMPFIGVMGLFTQVHYRARITDESPFDVDIFNFNESQTIWENKRMYGLAPIVGFKRYLDVRKHHVSFELYMGLGVKYKTFPRRPEVRTKYIYETNHLLYWDDGLFGDLDNQKERAYLYFPVGIKVGYRF